MAVPTAKELQKLAKACRAAGIKHYKSGDIEFTLTDEAPTKPARRSAKAPVSEETPDKNFESDELPYEALLNWSVVDVANQDKETA